eukprot:gb/GECG01001627.1/.p1 GENE.gb/GECG01001627.1/~~gb/GECG01001627.1/.p1  ORF type:complete len:636 (+),score=92.96 gb/GECG01001627.1/:1-1908(+)
MSRRRFSSSSATSATGAGMVPQVLQPPSWPSLRTFCSEVLGQKAPEWLMKWISDTASTFDAHAKDRIQVERDIDSKPLEPQLSAEVGEMMASEEQAAKSGQEQKRERLTQKIDERIRKECVNALEYIVRVHAQQREEVYRRHEKERKELRSNLEKLIRQHLQTNIRDCLSTLKSSYQANTSSPPNSSEPLPSLPRSPSNRSITSGNFAEEGSAGSMSSPPSVKGEAYPANFHDAEAFFREQTAEVWAQGEKFSLRYAFNNQIERMETEWREYLLSMESHFAKEYFSVTGCKPPECSTPELASQCKQRQSQQKEKKWLNKEKQEQLIHTAPVLGPTGEQETKEEVDKGTEFCGLGVSEQSAAAMLRKLNSSVQNQVSDLFRRYKEARYHVLLQRNEALRWIHRQCVRMLMQVDAAAVERAQVTNLQRCAMQGWDDLSVVALGVVHTMATGQNDYKRTRHSSNGGSAENLAKKLAQSAIGSDGKPMSKRHSTPVRRSRSDSTSIRQEASTVGNDTSLYKQSTTGDASARSSRSGSRPGSHATDIPEDHSGRRPRFLTEEAFSSSERRLGSRSRGSTDSYDTPSRGYGRPRGGTEANERTGSPLRVKTDCFESSSGGSKKNTRKSWHSKHMSPLRGKD